MAEFDDTPQPLEATWVLVASKQESGKYFMWLVAGPGMEAELVNHIDQPDDEAYGPIRHGFPATRVGTTVVAKAPATTTGVGMVMGDTVTEASLRFPDLVKAMSTSRPAQVIPIDVDMPVLVPRTLFDAAVQAADTGLDVTGCLIAVDQLRDELRDAGVTFDG